MSNQSDAPDQKPRTVQDIIHAIEAISSDGGYIYRGEPECYEGNPYYGKVSSTLWREYGIDTEHCDIEIVQNEMLNGAKKHLGHIPQNFRADFVTSPNVAREDIDETVNFEILTEIQHYGGKTNLIDFTKDLVIALFFACDGSPHKNGRVILQKLQAIKDMIKHPQNPRHRVLAQKSVFVRPTKGFIEPNEDEIITIPKRLKQSLLQHLWTYHDVSKETVYNDLHGFIRHQGIHEGAYTRFFRGVACQKVGKYGEAIEHYNKATRAKPDFAVAYYNRGTAYSDAGDCDSAIADYTRAIELNPTDAEAYNNRGWAFGNQGDHESALADYTKAIQSNPKHAIAYCNRGRVYGNTSDYDNALADFTKAIQLKPNYAEAYYNGGWTYEKKGDYDRAIANYTEAIKLNPDFADAYSARGNAHQKKGDHNRAIIDFDKAIQLNPNNAAVNYNRGNAHQKKSDYDRAIIDYTKAIELDCDFDHPYHNRGNSYAQKGNCDRAIVDYTNALELNPDLDIAYFNRGMAHVRLREWKLAKSDLMIAIDKEIDIITLFRSDYKGVKDFEQRNNVNLPEDIAAMLTPTAD